MKLIVSDIKNITVYLFADLVKVYLSLGDVMHIRRILISLYILLLITGPQLMFLQAQPIASPEEYGPYEFEKFYAVIFWIPCSSAGSKGVATLMLYPKEPRYGSAAPVVVYVHGGPYAGFFPFLDYDWDPHGIIWIYFIFPGGNTTFKTPSGEKLYLESGGIYDYRGDACYEALYSVLRFAQGKLASGSGKTIGDYVDYQVLTDNVGMYGSSYGGVMAAMVFARYSSGLENVKYIVFYESPATNFLTTTDLGRNGDDKQPNYDADGDGLPWNDMRNPNYVPGTCNETWCFINFTTLSYDNTVGFYLDNNGNGKPDYTGGGVFYNTDLNGNGRIDPYEDYIFRPWIVVLEGRVRKVYSYLVIKAASEKGLLAGLPSVIMDLDETYNFWYNRDMGFHYDEIVANAPWLKVMQLGFLKEHMCPAPDFPNIVVNYNAFKKRGIWIRLNPDMSYLEYVAGRSVEGVENAANIDITFDNVRDHLISDREFLHVTNVRKLIEIASVAEMADRVYFNNWDPDLPSVLTLMPQPRGVKVLDGEWVNIGPDGGDQYFVYVTSKHTVISATGNSAFRSTDGARSWSRITEENLVDVGFVSMAESEGVLFAGAGRGGMYISFDDGFSWKRINTGDEDLEKKEFCEIVSIVALSSKHLYVGIKSLNPQAKQINWVYELIYNESSGEWISIRHTLPPDVVPKSVKMVVYRLAYDPDFAGLGPTLFVSKYPSGLYMATNLTGEWKWIKIMDKATTDVDVAVDYDIVYLGTYNDWIYRGEYKHNSWKWRRIDPTEGASKPISLPIVPVISEVEVDPYNPNRVWWGTPGKLVRAYPYPEPQECVFGVFAWDPVKEEFLHSFITNGWGAFIAIDKHGEGEDPADYTITIDGVVGAKIAYTCSYSFRCLLKTMDGGRTWNPSYSGLYGECMNQIWFLDREPFSHTFIVVCQAGIEISYDYGNTWLDCFDLPPTAIRAGFPWCVLPLPQEYGYKVTVDGKDYPLDLLIITGYPGPVPGVSGKASKRYGLIAVSTEYMCEARKTGKLLVKGAINLTSNPAVYGILVDHYVVLALQEDGVEVYDLASRSRFISNKGLPRDGGVCRIAVYRAGGRDIWILATYEGEPTFKTEGNDHYFWDGPSRLFIAENLLTSKENTVWRQIYPSSGRTEGGIVSIVISGSGEMLALESTGKIIYCPDISSTTHSFKTLVLQPFLCSSAEQYTALRVDWNRGIVYISSIEGEGMYYAFLEDVRSSDNTVRIYRFNKGLSTRLIRHIALTPDGKYLFAGAWWSSSWRIEPIVREVAASVSIDAPEEASIGEEVYIEVTVETTGGERLGGVAVGLLVNGSIIDYGYTDEHGRAVFSIIFNESGRFEVVAQTYFGEASAIIEAVGAVLRIETGIPDMDVVVNGVTYKTDARGIVEITGYGEYTITVADSIQVSPYERIVFRGWSTGVQDTTITVFLDRPMTLVANYARQYKLTIESQYGSPSGAGWYDAGSTAHVSIEDKVNINLFQVAVFTGWSGDVTSSQRELYITMDSPKHLVANWRVELNILNIAIVVIAIVAIGFIIVVTLGRSRKKAEVRPPPPPPPPW